MAVLCTVLGLKAILAWEDLLKREHARPRRSYVRRSKWSRGRLEASGLAIFDATASQATCLARRPCGFARRRSPCGPLRAATFW